MARRNTNQLEAQERELNAELDALVLADIRDAFARSALPTALAEFYRTGPGAVWADYDDLAEHVWNIADAMLATREKGGS